MSVISRPPDCDTATLRGAAQYGLARRPLVSSVIAPRAYIMKVRATAAVRQQLVLRAAFSLARARRPSGKVARGA